MGDELRAAVELAVKEIETMGGELATARLRLALLEERLLMLAVYWETQAKQAQAGSDEERTLRMCAVQARAMVRDWTKP